MNIKRRKKYDRDFKQNAALLFAEPGRTVAEVAETPGISKNIFYLWRREYQNRQKCRHVKGNVMNLNDAKQADTG